MFSPLLGTGFGQNNCFFGDKVFLSNIFYEYRYKIREQGRSQGGAEGATAPPLFLKERFSKADDTMPKTR